MALVINTNLGSINGQKNLAGSATGLATSMQRLSSGVRVNNAKDDAAGLAIADRMSSQIRGMTVAVRNANDGISLTQTAEGALGSLTDTLQRMRDLAVQSSSNAGVSASDRAKMDTEFKALQDELIRVTQNSEFNGKKILNGDLAGGLSIQVGATTDTNSRINVAVSNMTNLLTPVTKGTLAPQNQAIDSTLASTVTNLAAGVTAAQDPQLLAANDAAKAANAAVVAAKAAAAAPTDVALAKAASAANLAAANLISASSTNIAGTTATNLAAGLVSDAFNNAVTAATSSNVAAATAIATTDATVQAGTSTDAAQSASLLTTATQLAAAAAADVTSAGQNAYAVTLNTLTGDTLTTPATTLDATTGKLATSNTLNDAINRATPGTFLGDREAQKSLAGLQIAKAIAGASYVNDPLATTTANETGKASFINNSKLVVDASVKADAVATDYALSAINYIDAAIASIDTERSNLGSTQNRFTTTISNLQNGVENQSAARSRIMDADFAAETANLSKGQILQQAGTAMLAQANQSGQSVLTLLR
ncbi:MAG: flagellin [Methylococcales bacterium]|nr:flagellin [Methylococcales bacterium]